MATYNVVLPPSPDWIVQLSWSQDGFLTITAGPKGSLQQDAPDHCDCALCAGGNRPCRCVAGRHDLSAHGNDCY